MKLANDLSDFITKYGTQLAAAAEQKLVPLFRPGVDPLPDLSEIEALRTSRHPACVKTGKPFRFFPAQLERIAGVHAALKTQRTAWLIEEMGCGKSPSALAIAWLKFHRKPDYKLLIMCPGHLVKKWRREAEWLLPHAYVMVISNFRELRAFQYGMERGRPMVAIIGKDTAKLGVELSHPCAASRKQRFEAIDPVTRSVVHRVIDIAACPTCGTLLQQKDGDVERPYPLAAYLHQPKDRCTVERCAHCGDTLATHYNKPGRYAKPHLDRYIQRHMRGVFDLLIADEVHELAAADSAQGNAFGTLGAACKYVLALTGTLIGGKAHDLHAPLWRMAPALVKQRGFVLKRNPDSKRSAIARNERSFIRRYGVMEQKITRSIDGEGGGRVLYGARSRRKQCKVLEHPKPGISPDLFNHFLLGNAVFMSLSELGPALPELQRELVPVTPSPELATAYRLMDKAFKDAMKDEAFKGGKGPPMLATLRVMVLDAYLDKPWGWKPVTAPVYEKGVKVGTKVVVVPPDLGALWEDAKDKKLLEIVQRELAAGRKCAIYPQYTGVHDVRPKLLALLRRAGIRVRALPDQVKPAEREAWIEANADSMDVLIAHPKRVMTGLDLIQFPTLIWYQCGYSTHVLRQASARARRPIQTQACKVIYLYYEGTMQEQAMSLMGEKEAASQMLEGVFDCEALRALMNGGKNDDILAALAGSLDKEMNARKAWEKVKTPEFDAEVHELFVFDLDDVEEEVIFG